MLGPDWQCTRLALVFTTCERFPETVGAYRRAIALDPSIDARGDIHNALGCALQSCGDMPEAMGEFQKAVADLGDQRPRGIGVELEPVLSCPAHDPLGQLPGLDGLLSGDVAARVADRIV